LSHSDYCVGVDLYSGKEICIDPVVDFSGRAAQLDLYTLLHQSGDELSVGIPRLNMTICIIRIVVEQEIGSVPVEDRNNVPLDVPVTESVASKPMSPIGMPNGRVPPRSLRNQGAIEHDIRLR
jgi:hypothetical protein